MSGPHDPVCHLDVLTVHIIWHVRKKITFFHFITVNPETSSNALSVSSSEEHVMDPMYTDLLGVFFLLLNHLVSVRFKHPLSFKESL